MTNRKTLTKSALAAILALGTLAGGAGVASAGDFRFSITTPQGSFVVGPNHPGGHFVPTHHRRWQAPVHRPHHWQGSRHVQPAHHLRPRQARRVLRQAGFRDISFLRERRNVYVFEARGWRGYRRIAVNKFTGQIMWRWGRG
ncbi:MAG: hypothetical protein KI785_01315 [Devosiaceae bacterium]|nr:hypothetical protein [Devosiaceae bacterium MH13]